MKNKNGKSVVKSYYVSRDTQVNWLQAYKTCKDYNMDLVELPTKAEADYFLPLCVEKLNNLRDHYFHIGGSYIGAEMNEFYWMTTGQRISYVMNFSPDNHGGTENCLSVEKEPESFVFNDISITEDHNYICQHIPKTESK